jgi:hypothetical protein
MHAPLAAVHPFCDVAYAHTYPLPTNGSCLHSHQARLAQAPLFANAWRRQQARLGLA